MTQSCVHLIHIQDHSSKLVGTQRESDTESSMSASDDKNLLEEHKKSSQDATDTKRAKLLSTIIANWKNIAASVCLWIAYFLCNTGFSIIAPFFPQEVYYYEPCEHATKHSLLRW